MATRKSTQHLKRQRRAAGELEGDVMAALWATDEPLTPAEVLCAVDSGLAYNTVMTTLSRLHDKGMVARRPRGRAYAYRPSGDPSDMAARRMREVLDVESDRAGVLQRFVRSLSGKDEQVLRELIEREDA